MVLPESRHSLIYHRYPIDDKYRKHLKGHFCLLKKVKFLTSNVVTSLAVFKLTKFRLNSFLPMCLI